MPIPLKSFRCFFTMFQGLPCLPNLSSSECWCSVGSLCFGKYTEVIAFLVVKCLKCNFLVTVVSFLDFLLQWFNDVFSTEISEKCEDILYQLSEKHGCKVSLLPISNSFVLSRV